MHATHHVACHHSTVFMLISAARLPSSCIFQPIHTLAFSKNSNTLAYGDGQGVISLFDLSKKHVSRTINGFNAAISSLSYDKGSEQLAFGDTLGNVGLYNALEDATSHLQRGPSSVR